MSNSAMLTTEEAAKHIGIPVQKLKNWRRTEGKGPEYYKLGGAVYYEATKLDAWVESCRVGKK